MAEYAAPPPSAALTAPRVAIRPLLRNVYLWMTVGLALTAVVAWYCANSDALLDLWDNGWIVFGAFIAQFALVVVLATQIMKLSPAMATLLFLGYAALTGFTLTGIVLYYDVGRSASVVVLAQEGGLALRTNGLPEALMESPGTLARFSGEYWLSPLAVLARPDTRDMLIVGFGGGVVVEGVPPSVEQVDVIELEPKVIEANEATKRLRKRSPLDDPRVRLIVNDARGALRRLYTALDAYDRPRAAQVSSWPVARFFSLMTAAA